MTQGSLLAALADRYRIERELGAGGMATVYLAQDLKHDRKVAIKVLRPELAAVIGAERFLSEIRTTANLQHPHILPLFDSGAAGRQGGGEATTFLFYVMPFVEGESLRDRLNREKQLPVGDAVRIAGEIASALDYAHRHSVIHRDIKPENILLHDGRALVADFGIALAASKAGGTRMTETGMSLGTPHYMSPEQAMGEREITPRSDVYALGAVTYEMLVGEPPFTGPTAQAIVAKVMTAEPADITAQRRTVPPHVDAAVLTALEKLPADRYASAAEFAQALAGGTERRYGGKTTDLRVAVPPSRRSALVGWSVAVLALGLAAWSISRRSGPAGPSVYDAALPPEAPMTFAFTAAANAYGTPLRNLSVSAEGDFAVYVAPHGDSTILWYRSLRDDTSRPIAGTVGATAPRVSPDGTKVAYFVGGVVMVAPVGGGEGRRLFSGQAGSALNWLSGDTLLALHQDGTRVAWLDAEAGQIEEKAMATRCPFGRWIPERRALLCDWNNVAFYADPMTGERSNDVRVTGAAGGAGALLRGSSARVVDRRYLVYIAADGDLRAAPYDPETDLIGRPVSLVRGIRREGVGEGQFEITATGALVYAPGRDATVGRLVRLRPGGVPEPLPVPEATYQRFDLSPDGRWLAAAVLAADGQELRIYDLRDGQQQTWLRADYIRHPLWSPAGDRLVAAVRDSTRWSVLSGSLSLGRLVDTLFTTDSADVLDAVDYHAADDLILQHWERSVVFGINPGAPRDKPRAIVSGDARFGSVSPDGRRLAYQTVEGNRIMVTSYPDVGRRWQVATEGAEPFWLAPTVLLYRSGISWYQVRVDPASGEPMGAATLWGRDPRFSDTSGWSNRPSRDGGIIYVQAPAETSVGYLRIIPNWVAQMKAAVDAAN